MDLPAFSAHLSILREIGTVFYLMTNLVLSFIFYKSIGFDESNPYNYCFGFNNLFQLLLEPPDTEPDDG